MKGSRRAKAVVLEAVQGRVPDFLTRHDTELGLERPTPAPGEYHDHWRPRDQLERWPAVLVTSIDGGNRSRIDVDDGDPRYRWEWKLRIWLWVREDGFDRTAAIIESLAAATLDALLSARQLTADVELAERVRVAYSDVVREPRTSRSIAGAWIEVVAILDETARLEPAATASTVVVGVEPLE